MNTTNNLQSTNAQTKTNYTGDSSESTKLNNSQRSKINYVRLNLTMLESKYGFINWRFLFSQMEQSSRKIDEILLENTDYLEQIELLFKRHDLETIDNYLCWSTIARFLPYLGSNFRHTFTDFRRKIPDPPSSISSTAAEQEMENFRKILLNDFNLFNNGKNADDYQLIDQYRKRKNIDSLSPSSGRMFLSRYVAFLLIFKIDEFCL